MNEWLLYSSHTVITFPPPRPPPPSGIPVLPYDSNHSPASLRSPFLLACHQWFSYITAPVGDLSMLLEYVCSLKKRNNSHLLKGEQRYPRKYRRLIAAVNLPCCERCTLEYLTILISGLQVMVLFLNLQQVNLTNGSG